MKDTEYLFCTTVISVCCVVLSTTAEKPSLAELTCLETCHIEQHRYCADPPYGCGDCLNSFREVGGDCLSIAPVDRSKVQVQEVVKESYADDVSSQRRQQSSEEKVEMKLADHERQLDMASTTLSFDSVYYDSTNDALFIAVIVCCSAAMVVGIVIALVCWCRLSRGTKSVSEVEYPAYGSTGSYPPPPYGYTDRKMAQSAQMFHYQHQKQQMLELEKNHSDTYKASSEPSSDGENDEDFTVYEYPGLAAPGEMEVQNPLYMESFEPSNGTVGTTNKHPNH